MTSEAPGAKPAEQLVWHYTKHDIIESIITNHTLWAGGIDGLNDPTELHTGVRRVMQAFKKLKREWDYHDDTSPDIDFAEIKGVLESAAIEVFDGSAFVICTTPAGDDVSQWQKYGLATGQGYGFSIAMPEGVRLPVLGEEPAPGLRRFGYIEEYPFRWIPLLYGKKDQIAAAEAGLLGLIRANDEAATVAARKGDESAFASLFRDRAVSNYVDAVAAVKNKKFKPEREVRYAITRPSNDAAVHDTPNGKQYVKVTGANDDPFDLNWRQHDPEYYQAAPSRLPIREICIGPGYDFASKEPWLRGLLDSNGYADVLIRRSKSPLQ